MVSLSKSAPGVALAPALATATSGVTGFFISSHAYTRKITASVNNPIVSMISANDLWRIFAQAPKITTAAPTLTKMFTYFSNKEDELDDDIK